MNVTCASCGAENPDRFRFCATCGSPLRVICPNCGAEALPSANFCGECGTPLPRTSEPSVEGRPGAPATEESGGRAGDRRPVTVMFADLVGYSTMAEEADPEQLRSLMTRVLSNLAREVTSREGQIEKFIGDAIMAVFGLPVAHEDDPARAIECAFAMLDTVRSESSSLSGPLDLRIGINSGRVVAGGAADGSTGVIGDAVNVAARLQQSAEPGEILVATSVWRRTRDRYDAQFVGALPTKGRSAPVETYRLVSRRKDAARFVAPFVGRRDELSLLEVLWASAAAGTTHVVSLVGEPGVGKSRLLAELPVRPDAVDLRIACDSTRPFGPFLELIGRALGQLPSDVDELRATVEGLGLGEDVVALLGPILGITDAPIVAAMADDQRRRQVFAGVSQFLLAALRGRPALIVLDDLHRSDRSSLDLLEFLLDTLAGFPLLLVLSYRPAFAHLDRISPRATHTGIRLETLRPDEATRLAMGYLGVEQLPADLEQVVGSRGEGNPFFIEELLQALLELGSLVVVDGRAVLGKVAVDIPDSVEGTVLARVDLLDPAERGVLQCAAVVGRSFSTSLMQALSDEADVMPALRELARIQLLVAHGPDQWAFKHGLIQEVVYGTLLSTRRRELHQKVAEELERRGADDPGMMDLLAEHFAKAEVRPKARRYALGAGDAAVERMGFVDARHRYETALSLWGEGDEEGRLRLVMKLAMSAVQAADPDRARTLLVEAESGWRTVGDLRESGMALAALGRVEFFTGDMPRSTETFRRAVEALEESGVSHELIQALVWGSVANIVAGDPDLGARYAERGLEMVADGSSEGLRSQLETNLGIVDVLFGRSSGMGRLRGALDLALSVNDPEALGRAYFNLALAHAALLDHREGIELATAGRETTARFGALSFEGLIASQEAVMLVEGGLLQEALGLCEELLEDRRGTVVLPAFVALRTACADASMRLGRLDEARRGLDEALPAARRMGATMFVVPALIVETELELFRGNVAVARLAAEEAKAKLLESGQVAFAARWLPLAIRLGIEAEGVLGAGDPAGLPVAVTAARLEATALANRDAGLFAAAAAAYGKLGLPFEEARCLVWAGRRDEALAVAARHGFDRGPIAQLGPAGTPS